MKLVIGEFYKSSVGFGEMEYLGTTYDVDGWLPTFRTKCGIVKSYNFEQLKDKFELLDKQVLPNPAIKEQFELWAEAKGLPVPKDWSGNYTHMTLLAWEAYQEAWFKSLNSQGIYRICSNHTDRWFVYKGAFKGPSFETEDQACQWAYENGYVVKP